MICYHIQVRVPALVAFALLLVLASCSKDETFNTGERAICIETNSTRTYYVIADIEQNLTQEQLGERIGVKRAQISRLERDYSITIPTMRRVFKALGVGTATIDLGIAGKVALW